ncbi:MAG: MSHA biogenesis protein MshK, partial [Burkholderiales bacterium]|nr:MSHA biogenesis protein MshK [Burkholderiales bacterium]
MARYLMLLLLLRIGACPAEELADPTKPWNPSGQVGTAENRGVQEPVLQSILISRNRRAAIIDGRTVKVGEKVGDAVVERIGEGQVVLKSG